MSQKKTVRLTLKFSCNELAIEALQLIDEIMDGTKHPFSLCPIFNLEDGCIEIDAALK